jgi:peroxiredoxin
MRRTIFAILAALTISVLVVGVCHSKEKSGKSEKDVQAPQFTLKNYDGKEVSLSDYAGKIVVLEWFNYECPFVVYHYEKPKTMAGLADKYKDKDVVWLAVNSTKHLKTEKNKAFAEEHKPGYPILDDRTGKVGRAYSAKTTPHMFIIDAKGKIVYNGGIDNSPMGSKKEKTVNYVDKALAELTADKAISTPKTKPYGCSVKYAR